jgi:hypothetical protein
MDQQERKELQRSRVRMGLISLALVVAGLSLMIANILFPVAAVLGMVGIIGLNLVRVGRP